MADRSSIRASDLLTAGALFCLLCAAVALAVLLSGCELVGGIDEKTAALGAQGGESTGGREGFSGGGHIGGGDGGTGALSGAGGSYAGSSGAGGTFPSGTGGSGQGGTAGTASGAPSAGRGGAGEAGTGGQDPSGAAGAGQAGAAGGAGSQGGEAGGVGTGGDAGGGGAPPDCTVAQDAPCGPLAELNPNGSLSGLVCLERCAFFYCGVNGWTMTTPGGAIACTPGDTCEHLSEFGTNTIAWTCECDPLNDTYNCKETGR